MKDWNPDLYRQFEAERTRPAEELLRRIPLTQINYATDLGCGPGNSTELLHRAWPSAQITGLDSSQAMIDQARQRLPGCRFELADIRSWQARPAQDVIYANASLQWLTDHPVLLPHLVAQLAPGGVLAVQMPDNLDQPTHSLMRDVAARPAWQEKIPPSAADRKRLLSTEAYYDLLTAAGCRVDIWRTTYYHVMPSAAAVVDWLRATGLRPYLAALSEAEQAQYLAEYQAEIERALPPRQDGNRLMAFPRLFMVAQKAG
ncbi:trans-aconitate 2-methyltransferase [Erwinia sp. Leaf53]|uniref:trans-aconitate 2-methyltransferase n=1 Tax=Erwinia sp. Leaf53 TaxID=1736225 RepID=UPI0006F9A881|nr:trans-aconitate 2-methyltransferase [Erwinia sp. Leaf53]KQN64768.1 trans-aconitate methyltransferase [Erwinia sp. Leaf53]